MLRYVSARQEPTDFLVATEANMLWQLQNAVPRHRYHPVPGITCACNKCPHMAEIHSRRSAIASRTEAPRSPGSPNSAGHRSSPAEPVELIGCVRHGKWSMVDGRGRGRGSRVEGRGSRVEGRGRGSGVEGRGSMVEGRWSRVEGRGSRVEGQWSMVESGIRRLDHRSSFIDHPLIGAAGIDEIENPSTQEGHRGNRWPSSASTKFVGVFSD